MKLKFQAATTATTTLIRVHAVSVCFSKTTLIRFINALHYRVFVTEYTVHTRNPSKLLVSILFFLLLLRVFVVVIVVVLVFC